MLRVFTNQKKNKYNKCFFLYSPPRPDVKCEFLNPGGSVKDRIGYRMVEDAEAQGRLKPGCTIIEPTSGNTGIGLAMACAVKGYKCLIVMPEKMSTEKSDALKVLGATIIRTPTEAGFESPEGLICVAQRLNKEIPDSVVLDQYRNAANPLAHYDGTGEEIVRQCGGSVDMVVCGAGTGGTISGIGRRLKERCPDCRIIAADPEGSILAEPAALNKTAVEFYEVEGIGYDFLPTVLDRSVVDEWYKCNDKESFPYSRRLIAEEGILSGASSGAVLSVAMKAAKSLKKGQKCVVILPDGIRNYMTKFVSDNWMEARGLKPIINEHKHWWWSEKVSVLKLAEAQSVLDTTTCQAALEKMRTNQLSHLNIVDAADGKTLKGVLTLAHVTKRVVSMNLQLTDAVDRAVFKQFRKITVDTELGLVARILEMDEFAIVVDDDGRYRFVTRMDLLTFIGGSSKPTNGTNSGH